MAIERNIYKCSFSKGNPPEWPCPRCGKGILIGVRNSFRKEETVDSKNAQSDRNWDPEWISYSYSCVFKCANLKCEEMVMSVGVGSVDLEPEFDESGDASGIQYYEYFRPTFFQPHLNIFKIPRDTPENIRAAISNSFALFFANPSSASNHLRIALELILDHLKVNKYVSRHGKRMLLSLHGRIQILPPNLSDIQDLLFAVKWLGNAGSHPQSITEDDVMDAYDMLERVLYELFEKRNKTVKKLAKTINKNKGPKARSIRPAF